MTITAQLKRKSGKSNKQIMTRLNKEAIEAAERSIKDGVIDVQADAAKSLNVVSAGESAKRYDPKRTVTVSKPGDAPNTDTGGAVSSIKTNIYWTVKGIIGQVGTNLKYLASLEFKWKNREARPWLKPAIRKNEKSIDSDIRIKLKTAAKKSGIA